MTLWVDEAFPYNFFTFSKLESAITIKVYFLASDFLGRIWKTDCLLGQMGYCSFFPDSALKVGLGQA